MLKRVELSVKRTQLLLKVRWMSSRRLSVSGVGLLLEWRSREVVVRFGPLLRRLWMDGEESIVGDRPADLTGGEVAVAGELVGEGAGAVVRRRAEVTSVLEALVFFVEPGEVVVDSAAGGASGSEGLVGAVSTDDSTASSTT